MQEHHHHHLHSRRSAHHLPVSLVPTQPVRPRRPRNHIWFYILITSTTFLLFLLFIVSSSRDSLQPINPKSTLYASSKFKLKFKTTPINFPLTNASSFNFKAPSPLNILVFYSALIKVNPLTHLDSILKDLPPYSLSIICSPLLPCPQIINSPTYHVIDSLSAYKPPMSSDIILVLDTDSLPSLDNTWLSNAAQITLTSPRIATFAGITLSSSTPSSMTCTTPNSIASIALAPFVLPTRSWPRPEELIHITTSLDLSLHLATRLDWSSIVIPLKSPYPAAQQFCHTSIQKLIEIKSHSTSSGHPRENTWPQQLDPKVGVLVTRTQLNLSNWFTVVCQLAQKFSTCIFFLQDPDENIGPSEKLAIKKTIQNSCTEDISINFISSSRSLQPHQYQHNVIHDIIQTHNSLELIFHLIHPNDPPLPQVFNKSRYHNLSSFNERDQYDEDDPIQSENGSNRKVEECVLIGLPVQEIFAVDWILGLELQALKNWHKPQIDISVITNDRSESLNRLLNSLETAAYYGDRVNIVINMEQTSDQKTRKLVERFQWKFGSKTVRQRIIQGGLLPAVIESWYPSSAHHSYGVLLEDDVEVSGYFYGWLKFSLLNYRYSGTVNDQIYGISLYQPQHNELRAEGRRPFNASQLLSNLGVEPRTMPYASQVPCSWGALFFPEAWVGFQRYLMFRLADQLMGVKLEDAVIPSPIRSNRWSKSWKKYMIEWVYLRGLIMIYPNYHKRLKLEDHVDDVNHRLLIPTGLSTNHLEFGTHVHNRGLLKSNERKTIRIAKWDQSSFETKQAEDMKEEEKMNKVIRLKKEFKIELKKLDSSNSLLDGLGTSFQRVKESHQEEEGEGEGKKMTMRLMKKLPNLNQLVILDLWGEPTNTKELEYRGLLGALSSGICDAFILNAPPTPQEPNEYFDLLSTICL